MDYDEDSDEEGINSDETAENDAAISSSEKATENTNHSQTGREDYNIGVERNDSEGAPSPAKRQKI